MQRVVASKVFKGNALSSNIHDECKMSVAFVRPDKNRVWICPNSPMGVISKNDKYKNRMDDNETWDDSPIFAFFKYVDRYTHC